MTCQELQELYELYALGALDGEENSEIDAHVARGCDNCMKGIANAMALNAAVMSFSPSENPPRELKHRVLAGVGFERPGWFWTGAFAAALTLIVALWLGVQERERTNQLADARHSLMEVTADRDRLTQYLQFLSDPQTKPVSFGRGRRTLPQGYVFLHPQLGVLLIASNLTAAGPGRAYEMWVIPKGGSPRPAGVFQASAARALHVLEGPLDLAMIDSVAVTLEAEAGSAAPTSPPIITAALGS